MDVVIYTADPTEIDATKISAAIEEAGYYVASVTIKERN